MAGALSRPQNPLIGQDKAKCLCLFYQHHFGFLDDPPPSEQNHSSPSVDWGALERSTRAGSSSVKVIVNLQKWPCSLEHGFKQQLETFLRGSRSMFTWKHHVVPADWLAAPWGHDGGTSTTRSETWSSLTVIVSGKQHRQYLPHLGQRHMASSKSGSWWNLVTLKRLRVHRLCVSCVTRVVLYFDYFVRPESNHHFKKIFCKKRPVGCSLSPKLLKLLKTLCWAF